MHYKFIHGFIIQAFNEQGELTEQQFIDGMEPIEWEDDEGRAVFELPWSYPTDLIQPNSICLN